MKRNHTGHRVGEWHHKAKIPDADIPLMRALREAGLTYREIAEKWESSIWTVRDICTYATRP